jgi:hypothetical protein
VEQVDPATLATAARSPDLPGGPMWPGGVAVQPTGDLAVVFGNHAHRLDTSLRVVASVELPRDRPYNSFVTLPDGHLVTKDFAGARPGQPSDAWRHAPPAELVVLDPDTLAVVARLGVPEPSVARLSAEGDAVYVVGTDSLWRVHWDGVELRLDEGFRARYRTVDGQTYGWDAVIALGAAWFLDDGEGNERYPGTFAGLGTSTAPLHLVRVDLDTAEVSLTEICGRPAGMVANPPIVDEARRIAVGYDSSNGVIAAFDVAADGSFSPRWRREQHHACHPLLFADSGALVTNDHDAERMMDQVVILDVETGEQRARADVGSPMQSVLFLAPGLDDDLYYCSFSTLARVRAATGS